LVGGAEPELSTQLSIVASIISITALSGLRVFGTNYLKHKAYVSIVKFFFDNICLQKLEHRDTYYSRSELVKCVHTDISALAEAGTRIFSITIKNVIAISVISYLLYKEHILFLTFGVGMCILRSYFLEKIARNWEKQLDTLNDIKRKTEEHVTEYINNVEHMQLYGLNSAYQTSIHLSLNEYDIEQAKESKILAVFMTSFSAITKTIDIGLFFVASLVGSGGSSGLSQLEKDCILNSSCVFEIFDRIISKHSRHS
jgi:ABC-type transport system involved in cytochrome bd biosynthesis fused ATPase/permease subunit